MASKLSLLLSVGLPLVASTSVCVTGAGGYVATEVVHQLLESGYHVKGTVRSLAKVEKYEHLQTLDEALPGTLTLLEADLLKEGSFDECAQGTEAVIHTASPFHFESKNMEDEMIRPAVEGTRNVMSAAAKAGVKKVVLTSSFAAVNSFTAEDKPDDGQLYQEGDWNEFTTEQTWGDNAMQAYIASKPLAEKTAATMAKKHGIELAAILPSLVMGPVLYKRLDAVSVNTMKSILEGSPLGFVFPWCDVRDVAKAHIKAMKPGVEGRYIISTAEYIPQYVVYDALADAFPSLVTASAEKAEMSAKIDNSKGRALLGGDFTPVEDSIVDMARSMVAAGLVTLNTEPVKAEL